MSGLSIFNAHPRLYWGEAGTYGDDAWMAIGATSTVGFLRIGDVRINTTGVLGHWQDDNGKTRNWAFPGWATIPSYYSLADGRRWHFFFAWIFSLALTLFMVRSFWNRHVQRDLYISRANWKPGAILRDFKENGRFRFEQPKAEYNIVQRILYVAVIFVLLPLMIFTGLAMSPAMDANWPILTDIFGGRQSARSIHFICAFLLVAFFLLHMVKLLLTRPLLQTWAMLDGRLPGQVSDEEQERDKDKISERLNE